MKDNVDQKIERDGNIWIYLIVSIIIVLFVTNKCGTENIEEIKTEYEKQYDKTIKTRTAMHNQRCIISCKSKNMHVRRMLIWNTVMP